MEELEWEVLKSCHRARGKEGETISETNNHNILLMGQWSLFTSILLRNLALTLRFCVNSHACLPKMLCSKSITNE